MPDDNVKDLGEARVARARRRVEKALLGFSDEDRAIIIERALREVGSDLKVEEER